MIPYPAHIYIWAFQTALSILVLPALYSQTFLTVWAGQALTYTKCTVHSCPGYISSLALASANIKTASKAAWAFSGIGSQGVLLQAPSVSSSLWWAGARGTVENVTARWFWMPPSMLDRTWSQEITFSRGTHNLWALQILLPPSRVRPPGIVRQNPQNLKHIEGITIFWNTLY